VRFAVAPVIVRLMALLDPNDPFFQPRWRRWATVLLPSVWALVEVWNGNPGWAIIFGAAGAYALYQLILKGPAT